MGFSDQLLHAIIRMLGGDSLFSLCGYDHDRVNLATTKISKDKSAPKRGSSRSLAPHAIDAREIPGMASKAFLVSAGERWRLISRPRSAVS
jgi:hypothetical protein